jgi:hypothetical protein
MCSLAANMTSFSYLFSLVAVTHTNVLKIRPVSVRVRLGAQEMGWSPVVYVAFGRGTGLSSRRRRGAWRADGGEAVALANLCAPRGHRD